MNELIDTFANRLNAAMRIRNIKAAELSEKTGISKSSISEYMNGKYEAKQVGVYLLAKALNVNEAWLMGLDVPMKKFSESNTTINNKKNQTSAIVFVYGTIPAGVPMECIEDIIDTEEISVDMLRGGKQYFRFEVKAVLQ